MIRVTVATSGKRQVLDITDLVNAQISRQKIQNGTVNLFLTHTIAALTTADLDPETDQDYLSAFAKLVPKIKFKHPHNPAHMPDHILSSLVGTSLTLPVGNGYLVLGTWQRVVLIEFDGPRERAIIISAIKEG